LTLDGPLSRRHIQAGPPQAAGSEGKTVATTITYKQVFGVDLGQEVQETNGVNYTPCQAVTSLKQQLLAADPTFFGGATLGGSGPLYKPWDGNKHEFNRHHAGLSVDIMLDPRENSQVALGQQLVLLFRRLANILRFRGMIYQHVSLDSNGQASPTVGASCWSANDHLNHIHIDWHSTSNTKWREGITQIPLRLKDGQTVIQMPVVSGNRIAESITWTAEADTNFAGDTTLQQELADLLGRHNRGELQLIDLPSEVGLAKC
jgi:hypothetical protein